MQEREQKITLHLDCHEVRLTIPYTREPQYRKAEELINRTYTKYRMRYPQKTEEDLWRFAALEIAVSLASDEREKNLAPVQKQLEALSDLLNQALEQ